VKTRLYWLDTWRGITVLAMMLFHFSYDLHYFQLVSIDIYRGDFWRISRYAIVSSFLVLVGISLYLAHTPTIQWRKLAKRVAILGLLALVVTLVSMQLFPKRWIYFGVLHFIGVASIVGVFFVKIPWVALAIGILIVVGYIYDFVSMGWLYTWAQPLLGLPRFTEDLVSMVPWMGAVLIGIGIARFLPQGPSQPLRYANAFDFLGRHALIVYMVHQPILFALLYPLALVVH